MSELAYLFSQLAINRYVSGRCRTRNQIKQDQASIDELRGKSDHTYVVNIKIKMPTKMTMVSAH
jgi:hypothetical protein